MERITLNHQSLFSVEGLVCGTCLVEVLERLHQLDGVFEVAMVLRVGGGSPVVVLSGEKIAPATLVAAVTDAGFTAGARSFETARPRAERASCGESGLEHIVFGGERS